MGQEWQHPGLEIQPVPFWVDDGVRGLNELGYPTNDEGLRAELWVESRTTILVVQPDGTARRWLRYHWDGDRIELEKFDNDGQASQPEVLESGVHEPERAMDIMAAHWEDSWKSEKEGYVDGSGLDGGVEP